MPLIFPNSSFDPFLVIDINIILSSSHYLHLKLGSEAEAFRGNAVAVSPNKAVTALHGHGGISDTVELFDSYGVSRKGKIIFVKFEPMKVDIAVVELDFGVTFSSFVPPCQHTVKLGQKIRVVGWLPSLINSDEYSEFFGESSVVLIEKGSTLFRAQYYCEDGLSGAGIIVCLDDGAFRVIGVHVASHDSTEEPPKIKKAKLGDGADAKSVSDSSSSLAASIHGHTAYNLICEIARVENLLPLISN